MKENKQLIDLLTKDIQLRTDQKSIKANILVPLVQNIFGSIFIVLFLGFLTQIAVGISNLNIDITKWAVNIYIICVSGLTAWSYYRDEVHTERLIRKLLAQLQVNNIKSSKILVNPIETVEIPSNLMENSTLNIDGATLSLIKDIKIVIQRGLTGQDINIHSINQSFGKKKAELIVRTMKEIGIYDSGSRTEKPKLTISSIEEAKEKILHYFQAQNNEQ